MDLRKHMEYLVKIGDESCDADIDCHDCPFTENKIKDCADHEHRVELAKQWLAEHPEEPAKVEPPKISESYRKSATREGDSYSITLSEGRLTIYHWHGKDSESMDFSGAVDDFNQFDEEEPEEWFAVAAKMIEIRSKK